MGDAASGAQQRNEDWSDPAVVQYQLFHVMLSCRTVAIETQRK